MSLSNPRRRLCRRFSDERIWREFYTACLTVTVNIELAAKRADDAYAQYRNRFPVRQPELDEEPAGLDEESAEQPSTIKPQ
jgi:hypothetical protein